MERDSTATKHTADRSSRRAWDGTYYTQAEFHDYYGREDGERLWLTAQLERLESEWTDWPPSDPDGEEPVRWEITEPTEAQTAQAMPGVPINVQTRSAHPSAAPEHATHQAAQSVPNDSIDVPTDGAHTITEQPAVAAHSVLCLMASQLALFTGAIAVLEICSTQDRQLWMHIGYAQPCILRIRNTITYFPLPSPVSWIRATHRKPNKFLLAQLFFYDIGKEVRNLFFHIWRLNSGIFSAPKSLLQNLCSSVTFAEIRWLHMWIGADVLPSNAVSLPSGVRIEEVW